MLNLKSLLGRIMLSEISHNQEHVVGTVLNILMFIPIYFSFRRDFKRQRALCA